MELRVLGPLEVRLDGVALPLGTPKQQVVLALLAVNAGRLVRLDDLVDELWPDAPPASAVKNVRSYAANLRRAREATAGGELAPASRLFAAARSRWRGQMLAGLRRGPILEARCAAIEEERLLVMEESAEAHLAIGEPDRAAALLREHVLMHPLRERAQAIYIRALYQTGDTAGALGAYTAARGALVEQLGVEPGFELQRAHRDVLRRAPVSIRPHPTKSETVPVAVPRELPPEPGCFVGRVSETAQLHEALSPRDPRGRRRPRVVVVYGEGESASPRSRCTSPMRCPAGSRMDSCIWICSERRQACSR